MKINGKRGAYECLNYTDGVLKLAMKGFDFELLPRLMKRSYRCTKLRECVGVALGKEAANCPP